MSVKEESITLASHIANQMLPKEPKEQNTEGQPNLWIRAGDKPNPVTEPRYMPLYTKESALLLSDTGIHFEIILFIAGIATP